jgi:hypothetical protein
MTIILKANKVNLFVSSVFFVFWYHSPNFFDTPRIEFRCEVHFDVYVNVFFSCVIFRGEKLHETKQYLRSASIIFPTS